MIVVVTGGRDYAGSGLADELARVHAVTPIIYLVCGDARGADTIAFRWGTDARAAHYAAGLCESPGKALPVRHKHCAYWNASGKGAGFLRNQRMIDDAVFLRESTGLPVLCIAAPGGNGTADCVRRAEAAKIVVRRVL